MDSSVTVPVVGILVAAVVSFVVNAVWFGPKTFYPVWWRALGKGEPEPSTEGMATVFALVALAQLVMAGTMSWLIQAAQALYGTELSVGAGALVGAAVGVGIAAAASLGHRLFAGQGFVVWAIEVGADVLGLTLMGAVLTFFV